MSIKAIVWPIVTGMDWCEPAKPIALKRDSKAAALRALRDAGYRVMWKGGEHDVRMEKTSTISGAGGTCDVYSAARNLRDDIEIQGDTEIPVYSITVWP